MCVYVVLGETNTQDRINAATEYTTYGICVAGHMQRLIFYRELRCLRPSCCRNSIGIDADIELVGESRTWTDRNTGGVKTSSTSSRTSIVI